jgi:indolepyruvate ferredoxin oxidoreductase
MPAKRATSDRAPPSVVTPGIDFARPANIVIGGIGGTGIVTIGAIVGMAAHLDGRAASVMDQIGLAQKGGEVTSHIRIALSADMLGPVRFAPGEADTMIGCDIAVASNPEVIPLLAKDAVAVVNDHVVMTGDFTSKPDAIFPLEQMKRRIGNAAGTTFADLSGLAVRQFGDAVGANMMALGMAWQRGRVPVSEAAILRAIELNGAAVGKNKAAFAWGRALAEDAASVEVLLAPAVSTMALSPDDIVATRAAELVKYQDEALAARYRRLVARAAEADEKVAQGSTELADAVARSFFKLLAYKDEYEVARLHVMSGFLDGIARDHSGGSLVFHMAPPLIARRDLQTGHLRKMRLGAWVLPILRILARLKFLRGTWVDPFGFSAERRAERRAIDDYERLIVGRIIPELAAHNRTMAVEIASLPLSIRGYGHVKTGAADKANLRQAELLARWPRDGAVQVAAE